MAPKRGKVIVCKVCGDKSNGLNYGVITCQPCKAFFQRSDNSAIENYFCLSEKKCEISLVTRSLCNYCRFQKCLSRGMSRDGKQISINIEYASVCGMKLFLWLHLINNISWMGN